MQPTMSISELEAELNALDDNDADNDVFWNFDDSDGSHDEHIAALPVETTQYRVLKGQESKARLSGETKGITIVR